MNKRLSATLPAALAASLTNTLADAPTKVGGRAATAAPGKGKGGGPKAPGPKTPGLFTRLEDLYRRMEEAYRSCAEEAGLTCAGCATNCCTSFFQHHTRVEWAYLWRGLGELPEKQRRAFTERAKAYLAQAHAALAANRLPTAMCPLNENGLCVLYPYRLMICRLHGTRNSFTLPDGRQQWFPGCARFAALPCAQAEALPPKDQEPCDTAPDQNAAPTAATCPTLDRTHFYKELAALEAEFLQRAGRPLPRVDMTLAEMIVQGPPRLR